MTRERADPAERPAPILLEWSLGELPSSQHRAGLAGLVLMVQWLYRQPRRDPGICEIERLDARGLVLRLDLRGLEELFDEAYGATRGEVAESKQRTKGKTIKPLRTEIDEPEAGGRPRTKYVYPQVLPRGAFLVECDPSREGANGLWVKLWRDMVWGILRGIPAQRIPFEARADGRAGDEAPSTWKLLIDPRDPSVDLPSTYYLGAQAHTAERVQFYDRARTQFLLHFAAYTFQVYVPMALLADGKREAVGYALVVPDVADLAGFCEVFADAMMARGIEKAGFRPRGAQIDLPAESALDFCLRLRERLAKEEGARETAPLLLGLDVFQVEKEGNNVRLRGTSRVEPTAAMVDDYRRVRSQYWDPVFRRQRLDNLFAGRAWHSGFDRLLSTTPAQRTIRSEYFCRDAREAFQTEI